VFRSVPQYFPLFRGVPHYSAVFRSIPQCSAVFRSIPRCSSVFPVFRSIPRRSQYAAVFRGVPQCSAVFRSIPRCFAVFRSVPQYSAVFRGIPLCLPLILPMRITGISQIQSQCSQYPSYCQPGMELHYTRMLLQTQESMFVIGFLVCMTQIIIVSRYVMREFRHAGSDHTSREVLYTKPHMDQMDRVIINAWSSRLAIRLH